MPDDQTGEAHRPSEAVVFPVDGTQDPIEGLELFPVKLLSPPPLGALGVATEVCGPPGTFPRLILRQPFAPGNLTGIDARTVRVFRVVGDSFQPVWDSGINVALGFVWSRISRSGVYAPLGLPRDRLLSEMLRALARARRYRGSPEEAADLACQIFNLFFVAGGKEVEKLEELREALTHLEIRTSPGGFLPGEIRLGREAVPLPFPLPGGVSFEELKTRLDGAFKAWPAGLPEEALFFPPERPDDAEPPWLILPERLLPRPAPTPAPGEPLPAPWPSRELGLPEGRLQLDERLLAPFASLTHISPEIFGWLLPRDWWMHHRDAAHTGDAQGSAIRRTNAGTLIQRRKICLDGPIVSMPCVVAGKVYVGTSTLPDATGGTLYKIDLITGNVDARFSFSGDEGDRHTPHAGVGSSPAVTGGKVYFSALTGKVYCLDAATLACLWCTDLRHTDRSKKQPVDHGAVKANGWSSPLVVNDRVYVGFGEGERNTFGFVYCLSAATGKVIWLFCTNQFATGVDNKPNVIPLSAFDPKKGPLPKKFTLAACDPCQRGASPWSAPAYCAVLNRIYIGTGNSWDEDKLPQDDPLPDPHYASGLLSLDATTGELKGFFQPCPSDSYRPDFDLDVDVPAGPMLFTRDGKRHVCFGSKNGSFFILDAGTMRVKRRRQLLPKDSAGNPFEDVDQPAERAHENRSGVFGTAALAPHLSRIFVGLGGYIEEFDSPAIDPNTTPFIRAVDWDKLADAWPTAGTNPPKYSAAQPPVYRNLNETAFSSPAVVNDVVFVSTTLPALYAFDAETGLCLWVAPGIAPAPYSFALGPAIYGNYVVNGLSNGHLYIYSL